MLHLCTVHSCASGHSYTHFNIARGAARKTGEGGRTQTNPVPGPEEVRGEQRVDAKQAVGCWGHVCGVETAPGALASISVAHDRPVRHTWCRQSMIRHGTTFLQHDTARHGARDGVMA